MFDFSPIAEQWLRLQGWYPERRVDTMGWLERLATDGVTIFPLLKEVLARFGGLPVNPDDELHKLTNTEGSQSYNWFMLKDGLVTTDPLKGLYHPTTVVKLRSLPWLIEQNMSIASIGKFDDFQMLLLVSDGSLYYGGFYDGLGTKKVFALHQLGKTFAEGIHQLVISQSLLS